MSLACETGLVFTMVGNEEGFIRLHSDGGNAGNADSRACGPCSEDESRGLATDALGGVPVDSVGRLKREERNRMLRVLKNAGFSVRLLQRLTGLGYTIVRNA